MSRLLPLLFLLLLGVGTGAGAGAAEPLPDFRATYALSRDGLDLGVTEISLTRQEDGSWIYASHAEPGGLLSLFVRDVVDEESRWQLHEGRIRPVGYRYHRHGGKRERLVELLFDWQNGRVTNEVDDDRWSMEIPPYTLDKLVYQLAIALDLADGRREMAYEIADGGHLKSYLLQATPAERVETPLGEFDALVVNRTKESSEKTTRLWCAKRLHYLPVVIEQEKKEGETLRMVIQSIEGLGQP